jgi:tetratricopeptide (TPR) repeat protein
MLYGHAIQKNSNSPILYTNRANARLKLGKYNAAIDDCIRSIEVSKDNLKAYYFLGTTLCEASSAGLKVHLIHSTNADHAT